MKKKEEIYVVIDTPKKAKKVKKVLDIFGENIYESTNERLINGNINDRYPLLHFDLMGPSWCGLEDNGPTKKVKTEVSIKELRNLLAIEHLKEGDVVVVDNNPNGGRFILKLTGKRLELFEHNRCYCLDNNHLDTELATVTGGYFIRYATEEEKALLDGELTISDYKLGVWYKSESGALVYFNDTETTYGFRSNGDWTAKAEWISEFRANGFHKPGYWKEATKEEVEQALIKEAKKRGYADGVKVRCLGHKIECTIAKSGNEIIYHSEWNKLWFGEISDRASLAVVVFQNGKWAEIVEPSFVESSDKIKVAGEDIGKRVRVIDGGSGAYGANDQTGVLVDKSTLATNGFFGSTVKVKTDDGKVWALNNSYHEIEYLTESSPLTVSLEIKDIATLQVIQKTLKELEEKLTKLI